MYFNNWPGHQSKQKQCIPLYIMALVENIYNKLKLISAS